MRLLFVRKYFSTPNELQVAITFEIKVKERKKSTDVIS
jgi:hypothetical protein